MAKPVIGDVSDTAFWIAHHRAAESARKDALFHDPLAGKLSGHRGRRISSSMPVDRMVGWTVAIRTCIIDDYIRRAIDEGIGILLNLGAGLDTRPYRMDLPESLRWIEADYPHLIEYKEKVLADEQPRCRLERVRIDLADVAARRHFLGDVDAQARPILVLTEGVVPYLTVEQAASLADDLRAMRQVRGWIVDYFSPQMMKFRRSKGMERQMGNAPFKFDPADWFGFFREHGWQARETRYMFETSEHLHRPLPLPPLLKVIATVSSVFAPKERIEGLRKFAGYVLLAPSR